MCIRYFHFCGFIDVTVLTINEGSKYRHGFIGITPLINSPLSNAKVSVPSCVLPRFGVLYNYYGSSVIGKKMQLQQIMNNQTI